jgi:bifunctional non-homologous end joining protein LigD
MKAKPATSRTRPAARPRRTPRLEEYEAKRDFAITPEPAPGTVAPSEGRPTFMVHKHHATRMHYDLRLEMDGALASWAVPKGPSYDPSTKRLAVQTEDHPLEYGGFEGRIPDAEYGGGDSLIWDRGTYDTVPPGQASQQRKKGHIVLELDGEKLKGKWHLVRTRPVGGKAQWLLFKAKDEHANAAFDVVEERPASVISGRALTRGPQTVKSRRVPRLPPEELLGRVFPPMLATLVKEAPHPDDHWVYEVKYDGYRALAGLSNGRVTMWSRRGLDLTPSFPRIARALSEVVVGDAVIDGEVVAFDDKGRATFHAMQTQHQGQVPSAFYAFDLLWLDGEDLRRRPLEERRDLLLSLLGNSSEDVRVAERLEGPAARALDEAREAGHEGILAKERGSIYEGTRARTWLKLKTTNRQEVVVLGFTPTKGQRTEIGALLVGVADGEGGFRYAGKVGTGFTSKERVRLLQLLEKQTISKAAAKDAPRMKVARWVTPDLVVEVAFAEWTPDGKLRHPSFQGVRTDKRPEECVVEKPALAPAPVEITLTSPTKVLFPADGITKEDLAAYYQKVSGPMLAALAGRPLSLEHWPKGIAQPSWFQQNIGKEGKDWMTLLETPTRTSKRSVRHLVADRPETLRWLAQQNVLTVHMWSSHAGTLESPDWVVFDLDPAKGEDLKQTIEPAMALKRLLDELKLPSYPKTSGKRGLHVFVPLAPGHTHEEAADFACRVADALAAQLPGVTTERALAARHGRLYLDCLQNAYGKTIVAPYSPRAAAGAPVSAPLTWDEVTPDLDAGAFTIRTMPERLATVGDLFAPVLSGGARLPKLK